MINLSRYAIEYWARCLILMFAELIIAADWAGCQRAETIAQQMQRTSTQAGQSIKPVIREGRLLYFSGRFGAPRLTTIPSFIDLYTDNELATVTELNLAENDISRIEGLKRLPNLKILELGANQIDEISGLEEAPDLEILSLTQNRIKRIEGLEPLVGLKELYLGRNLIEKIENLSSLVNLEVLNLEWNKIRTIEGLGNLKSLRWLIIGGNQLHDYSGLLELDQVKEIALTSPHNVVDEKAIQVFKEWNRRHPDEQITY